MPFKLATAFFCFLILVSCVRAGRDEIMVGEETHAGFLSRLERAHGEKKYFYVSSYKHFLDFQGGKVGLRPAIVNHVQAEARRSGVCGVADVAVDKTGSWTGGRDSIYVNFYCENKIPIAE